jgi:Putative Actinobacterial Holin-X, holin superfamily III
MSEAMSPPPNSDQSVGDLVSGIASDLSTLMRQELDLAKAEIRQEASKAGKAAGMLGGAGLAGWMVALFLSFTLLYLLDSAIDAGWAALIVALIWAVIGAVLFVIGRNRLKSVDPTPHRTVETVKEDVQWLKSRNS